MMEPIHVYPTNDLGQHLLEMGMEAIVDADGIMGLMPICNCKCAPDIRCEENGVFIIVHNAYDGREGLERADELLNN